MVYKVLKIFLKKRERFATMYPMTNLTRPIGQPTAMSITLTLSEQEANDLVSLNSGNPLKPRAWMTEAQVKVAYSLQVVAELAAEALETDRMIAALEDKGAEVSMN